MLLLGLGRLYFLPMPSSTTDAWNATKYNTTASFVYSDAYTAPVLDLLNAQSGEKIVDFGCGTGELTKLLTNIVGGHGTVLGLDASENMVSSLIYDLHPVTSFRKTQL